MTAEKDGGVPSFLRGVPPESAPEFFSLLLENSLDAVYVVDNETQRFIYVNKAFETLMEYSPEQIAREGISPADLVAPEEREAVRARGATVQPGSQERYVFTGVTRTGKEIPVEVSVHRLLFRSRRVTVGVAREISTHKVLEKRLRDELELQRKQTLGAFQSNVRIYQLTEKIRSAYESTRNILKCRTLDELGKAVIQILTDPNGLNYRTGRFYHVDGRWLRLLASTDARRKGGAIDLRKNHELARLVRGEILPEDVPDQKVIPLTVRDDVIGLLVLVWNDEEKARVWQDSIVGTLAGLISLMIDNLALYEKVKAQTVIDPLTKLFNRRHFDEKVKSEFNRAFRYKRDLAVAMIDIDNFKRINDTYGHQQGDVILRDIAKILGTWTRSTDLVFRFGGEEFVLVFPETSSQNAFTKAESLRALIEQSHFTNLVDPARPFRATVSVGVSGMFAACQKPEDLIQAADEALYASKHAGKNRTTLSAQSTGGKPSP